MVPAHEARLGPYVEEEAAEVELVGQVGALGEERVVERIVDEVLQCGRLRR